MASGSASNKTEKIDTCLNSNVNLSMCPQVEPAKVGFFKFLSTCNVPTIVLALIDNDNFFIYGK